jgi:hypothetical protein
MPATESPKSYLIRSHSGVTFRTTKSLGDALNFERQKGHNSLNSFRPSAIFDLASALGTRTDASQLRFGQIAATTTIAMAVSIIEEMSAIRRNTSVFIRMAYCARRQEL